MSLDNPPQVGEFICWNLSAAHCFRHKGKPVFEGRNDLGFGDDALLSFLIKAATLLSSASVHCTDECLDEMVSQDQRLGTWAGCLPSILVRLSWHFTIRDSFGASVARAWLLGGFHGGSSRQQGRYWNGTHDLTFEDKEVKYSTNRDVEGGFTSLPVLPLGSPLVVLELCQIG